jgi:TonB family protein
MAAQDHRDDARSSRLGYTVAIVVSGLGHAALFALVFLVMPRYLKAPDAPPPAYTVKIVDNIPAGDLGTHLPRLAQVKREEARAKPPEEPKVEPPKPPPVAPEPDKNAIALNSTKAESPTPTPTPEPAAEPTVAPTAEPTTAPPTRTPKPHATPRPTPVAKKKRKPAPSIAIAKVSSTASVEQRMARLRERLLAEHLKSEKSRAAEEEDEDEDTGEEPAKPSKGGGPVVANVATAGSGAGVGPGSGSAGIQQDLDFLLYYQTVQKKIKDAWNFPGGSSDLTTTVDFAINPDGTLAGVRIAKSSNDSAFDDSVIRAIRRAAPFPAPPDKFRDQFAAGIQALFKLGELKSSS